MDYKAKAKDYLKAFEAKNVSLLTEMFADDIYLRDWVNGTIRGKEAVLKEVLNIFGSCNTIKVGIDATHAEGAVVVCELSIVFDGKEPLLVTDIIGFNSQGKIEFVRASHGGG